LVHRGKVIITTITDNIFIKYTVELKICMDNLYETNFQYNNRFCKIRIRYRWSRSTIDHLEFVHSFSKKKIWIHCYITHTLANRFISDSRTRSSSSQKLKKLQFLFLHSDSDSDLRFQHFHLPSKLLWITDFRYVICISFGSSSTDFSRSLIDLIILYTSHINEVENNRLICHMKWFL
jgi:hypothetical protein